MLKTRIKTLKARIYSSDKRVKAIFLMGLLALLLILLSELLPDGGSEKTEADTDPLPEGFDTGFCRQTEERLSLLLSDIRGVGKAEVILSVDGSEEYIYAEETEGESVQGDTVQEKYKSKLFVSERSGGKDALIRKIVSPKFTGALVICDGGSDAAVRERVIKAVSAALDLPSSKICVESRKI